MVQTQIAASSFQLTETDKFLQSMNSNVRWGLGVDSSDISCFARSSDKLLRKASSDNGQLSLSIFTTPRVEIAVPRLQHLLVSPYCGCSRSHSSMSFPSHSASLIHSLELSPQLLANQATHSGASRAADSSETEGIRSRLPLTISSLDWHTSSVVFLMSFFLAVIGAALPIL